ncbi:MAG TPA: aconitate hydratase [Thermoanaerobaculia bacterium]|nr:aconitate hydratase [Thermoanaerobaculia bacterium]
MSVLDRLRQAFPLGSGGSGQLVSLPRLEREGFGAVGRLPVSIRVVLESLARNCDGKRVKEDDVRALAAWKPSAERTAEVPFVVARIVLQDFTGVPLLVDLAAMRSAVARVGRDPKVIEPLVPVALVVDHSIQVDEWSRPDALDVNMRIEFERNRARYEFLKWGMQAFRGFEVVPPGIGIVHQVNLEYLAQGVLSKDGVYYPDSLVGTDSHTTMINGLGIVGWGVGGIEAEAGMLGQPVYFLTPDVVGVHLTGRLAEGVTATDLVLAVTEMLRKARVVGKFVEFFGEGAASLPVTDRATVANMAPEYGATMGFFPVDEETCRYLLSTGRTREHVETFRNYWVAQGLFGVPRPGDCDYSQTLELDLGSVRPSVSGPKRPQDRIPLPELKARFRDLFGKPVSENGYGKDAGALSTRFPATLGRPVPGGGSQAPVSAAASRAHNTSAWTESEMANNHPTPDADPPGPASATRVDVGHGDVLIAAITSCTNTSNPSVMLAAGLVAKKAVERGLFVSPRVKASLAPGSRVVTEYLARTGLQRYLDRLGFHLVGYGCTTCIGNSGPLDAGIEQVVTQNDLVTAAVLSGNRNFEARIHQNIKANFLMSPPLVVAFALAGRADIDMTAEPLGTGRDGKPVYLRDVWPSTAEVQQALLASVDAATYKRLYADLAAANPLWREIPAASGTVYAWDPASTYIQEPPFFEGFSREPAPLTDIRGARALAIFGDSVTTDHISPAGAIKASSPAGVYLQSLGVAPVDFNSYGSRRGNDRVMTRGTFANVRIKNLMVPGVEGGVTCHQPDGAPMTIYDAALRYQAERVPLIIFAGQEYGTGSSRDWAAKGTRLLGVRAVVAQSYERIHRSNLVGMGVLPLQFPEGTSAASLGLDGTETFELEGLSGGLAPRQETPLVIRRADGGATRVSLKVRIDTPIEADYYRHGGILPFVLRQLLA